jgi:hypothetical protein
MMDLYICENCEAAGTDVVHEDDGAYCLCGRRCTDANTYLQGIHDDLQALRDTQAALASELLAMTAVAHELAERLDEHEGERVIANTLARIQADVLSIGVDHWLTGPAAALAKAIDAEVVR